MSDDRNGRGDRDDLEERVEELETTIRDLRSELRQPPRGAFGLPRPPTPREVLSFTGEYAIPTLVAMLEANVRALKALQQILRLVDPERGQTREARSELGSRANRVSRATLDRLESTLEEVEGALTEGGLPREPAARRLLEDARKLSEDIREEVSAGRERADAERDAARAIDIEDAGGDEGGEDESAMEDGEDEKPEVDVDAELRSIRKELGVGEGDADDAAGDDASDTDSNAGDSDDSDE
ncbi:DUF7547 family protein [Haladaptatus salinisoli]|uniref:DUF7547 family protein n=1 Tax=Haladaptatus salinisoli TaxID=2884876 RepID=UPI001D0A73ED|nr:hypothetical protein [Haladaptatus salinisoli]